MAISTTCYMRVILNISWANLLSLTLRMFLTECWKNHIRGSRHSLQLSQLGCSSVKVQEDPNVRWPLWPLTLPLPAGPLSRWLPKTQMPTSCSLGIRRITGSDSPAWHRPLWPCQWERCLPVQPPSGRPLLGFGQPSQQTKCHQATMTLQHEIRTEGSFPKNYKCESPFCTHPPSVSL